MSEPNPVIIKTLLLERDSDVVFDFFSDLKNWESGGALKNTKKLDDGWWYANTPNGEAKIKIKPNRNFGIFDHLFDGGGGMWTVYCRVTPNGNGSTVTWTFTRPQGMSQENFESQLGTSFDNEMEGYRQAILSMK